MKPVLVRLMLRCLPTVGAHYQSDLPALYP